MIRSYRAGDEKQINRLFMEVFGKVRSQKAWEWKFLKNPLDLVILSLFCVDEQIVGHNSVMPRVGTLNGRNIVFGLRTDTMVSDKHRGLGIYKSLIFDILEQCKNQGVSCLYGFPAPKAKELFQKYTDAVELAYVPRLTFVRRPSKLLASKLPVPLKMFASLFAPIDGFYKLKPNLIFDIEKISRFDDRIDQLWEQARNQFNIILVRDKSYLNWRFAEHPERNYQIYVLKENSDVVGYVVTYVSEQTSDTESLKIGYITDILALNNELYWQQCVLLALKQMEQADIVMTWALSHTIFYRALRSARFMHKDNPMPLVVKEITECCALDVNDWYITPGDVDSF